MSGLSTPALIAAFAFSAGATWVAGVFLARSTDSLDERWSLGEALGGMVLLALAGTLPEIAITVSAALRGDLAMAAGNLIGGIAIQTAVIAVCDFTVRGERPLSYLVGSLLPVLESCLVVGLAALVLMGALLPPTIAIGPASPASIAIVLVWLAGLWVLYRVRTNPQWEIVMPGSEPGRPKRCIPHPVVVHPFAHLSTTRVALVFAAGSAVTLAAGVGLEVSGAELATRAGLSGVVFGATVLALSTALPEISSGISAVRLGDNQLAMSDVFGGNAFQVCLFLVADLMAGRPVLPAAGNANAWLATLGIVLSLVYAVSVVARPSRRYSRLGVDSIAAFAFLAIGILGLTVVAR